MRENSSDDEINILNISDTKDEINNQPRISMLNPIETKSLNLSVFKQKKRTQSLPLKSFKITCPANSKILSSVCDNIFEDEVINENINLSMFKIKSNINIKNTFSDIENNKKKNITKAKTISVPEKNENMEKIENGEEDDDFPQITRPHKKSFIFNNILKIKNIKCPRLLEEQWKYEKILLDYNIIDFTSKKIKYNINSFYK